MRASCLALLLVSCTVLEASDPELDGCDTGWEDVEERLEATWADPEIRITQHAYAVNCDHDIEAVEASSPLA
jgi:hypothetical protein